ncbi:MAG: hypothetical protein V3T90_05495 [Anaerolineae bacterium]
MDCEFCSITAFNGRRYRRRPPEEVLDELETIPQKMLFFVDDNIIGYGKESREQALVLFRGMVERGLDKWWFCQASLNFADDEDVLDWAGRAGCKMVFLGLEAEGVDVMQTTYLTPLPGTRLFGQHRNEGRLLYTDFPQDWDHYDMTELAHHSQGMKPETLSQTMRECNRRMYAWPVLVRKAMRTFRETRTPTATMFAWQSNINYRNVAFAWQPGLTVLPSTAA